KALEPLRRVNAAGTHLLNLINEILDLSKIEAGKLDLNPEPVDLTRLICRCGPLPTERSRWSPPLRTRPRSQSKMCACSMKSRRRIGSWRTQARTSHNSSPA